MKHKNLRFTVRNFLQFLMRLKCSVLQKTDGIYVRMHQRRRREIKKSKIYFFGTLVNVMVEIFLLISLNGTFPIFTAASNRLSINSKYG